MAAGSRQAATIGFAGDADAFFKAPTCDDGFALLAASETYVTHMDLIVRGWDNGEVGTASPDEWERPE